MSTEIRMDIVFPDDKVCREFLEYCLTEFAVEPDIFESTAYLTLREHGDRVQALERIEKLRGKIVKEEIDDDC